MSPQDLLGLTELAEHLQVGRTTAFRYAQRADFPAPAETLARGRVWLRSDIDEWAKAHLPLQTGRPRKAQS